MSSSVRLRYLSVVSWFSQMLQVVVGVFGWAESDHSWYVFFSIFSTYTLLPLPLLWSIVAGASTSTLHLLLDVYRHYEDSAFVRTVGAPPPFSWLVSESIAITVCSPHLRRCCPRPCCTWP